MSDLAQHHYLVALFAWQLGRGANRAGAKLNIEKILEWAIVHDLGELFGGDICMPYGKVNRRAKKLAKIFEAENQKYFAKLFGPDQKYLSKLFKEVMEPKTDEAIIGKMADYLESAHYRLYIKRMDKQDFVIHTEKFKSLVKNVKDKAAKKYLTEFVDQWAKSFYQDQDISNIMNIIS